MAELILALDLPDGDSALRLLDRLPGVSWVKVGSILMTREGPDLVRHLAGRGLSVFLDLKWHDIPDTVRGAVTGARDLEVRMVTVHTLGGREMMAAARDAAGSLLAVVGVTVLTSHTQADYAHAVGSRPVDLTVETIRQAQHAVGAGLDGIVASPHEVGPVRAVLGPEPLIVVPGLRRLGDPVDDQRRTATPGEAVLAGATHLVVGRSVVRAVDPVAAWEAIREEMATCAA